MRWNVSCHVSIYPNGTTVLHPPLVRAPMLRPPNTKLGRGSDMHPLPFMGCALGIHFASRSSKPKVLWLALYLSCQPIARVCKNGCPITIGSHCALHDAYPINCTGTFHRAIMEDNHGRLRTSGSLLLIFHITIYIPAESINPTSQTIAGEVTTF